jgi:tetratricopeptide (TPR) repeat protein
MEWGTYIGASRTARGRGEFLRAERCLQRAARKADLPAELAAMTLKQLAELLDYQDRLDEAETFYRRALGHFQEAYEEDHPCVLSTLHYMTTFYSSIGRAEDEAATFDHLRRSCRKLWSSEELQPTFMVRSEPFNDRDRGFDQWIHFVPNQELLERYRRSPAPASELGLVAQYYHSRGWINVAMDVYLHAVRSDERRGAPDPLFAIADLRNLAELLETTGRTEDAAALEKRAAELSETIAREKEVLRSGDPGAIATYFLRQGCRFEQMRDYPRAADAYRQALAHEPSDRATWYFIHNNLGFSLNQLQQFQDGERLCRKAIQIDPDRSNAHKNLGLALAGQGRFVEAVPCYLESALVSQGSDPRGMMLLSGLLREHPEVAEEIPDIQEQLRRCEQLCEEGQQRLLQGLRKGKEQ